MTMTMSKETWMQVLQSASVPELEAALTKQDTPSTLLHWACQLPSLDLSVLQCLVQRFPEQLNFADHSGRIPLHYVCQRRSFSALSWLHVLLQAAPDTILMPLFETNTHNMSGTDGSSSGILPAVLAHRSLAPPTLVQYLLRRQIEAHGGLVLRHEDLMHLEWNEGSFVEHVAEALKTTSPTIIKQVCLEECRLSYESWQTLQVALQQLPANTLQKLQLLHVHIWHAHPDVRYHHHNHHNNNHHEQEQQEQPLSQRAMVEADVALWQRLVDHHKCSLQQLELPQFYALTTTTVNRVAQHLANQEFAALQVLDARTCIQQPAIWDTNPLAKALTHSQCRLKKLALQAVTVEGYRILLQALHNNRSVLVFQIGDIVPNGEKDIEYENENDLDTTSQQPIPWSELRLATQQMLQRNTALERLLAPRPLIHCHSIQLYLKLNRDYHRRDVGHWSPGLLAHVLAKVKLEAAHTNSPPTTKSWYFPTHEPVPIQDPNSALFYFLQSRPDILLSKQ